MSSTDSSGAMGCRNILSSPLICLSASCSAAMGSSFGDCSWGAAAAVEVQLGSSTRGNMSEAEEPRQTHLIGSAGSVYGLRDLC